VAEAEARRERGAPHVARVAADLDAPQPRQGARDRQRGAHRLGGAPLPVASARSQ
jgi:hypothetical protein